jgi:hypothetical protein
MDDDNQNQREAISTDKIMQRVYRSNSDQKHYATSQAASESLPKEKVSGSSRNQCVKLEKIYRPKLSGLNTESIEFRMNEKEL